MYFHDYMSYKNPHSFFHIDIILLDVDSKIELLMNKYNAISSLIFIFFSYNK